MLTMVERVEGHYEVQDVEFGQVYRWCPECVVVECDCGERLSLTGSTTVCSWCGAAHTDIVQEEQDIKGQLLRDEDLHPWRYAGDREDIGIPF
jgi:hypothetical protein